MRDEEIDVKSVNAIRLFIATFAMALAGAAQAQSAETYPSKAIRFIVPFPPGGNTDLVARAIGPRLTERWNQQILIDNRGGANTIIGAELASKAPPDGYTIFLATATTISINPYVYSKLPYDAERDFAPVAPLVNYPYIVAAHPSVPANSPKELIALAKAEPGKLTYASAGNGSSGHLAGALLETMTGIRLLHVPFKGTGAALLDTLAGRVMLDITGMATVLPYLKTRRMKVIAVCSETRLAAYPDIPAFGELPGLKGYEGGTWFGVVVPARTPQAVIDKLNGAISAVVSSPEVKAQFASLDFQAFVAKPDAFARFIETDRARTAKVVKASNIRLD
jgi:tripartite-type tricarboxylate transporter receptor subunit TctC